jgi:HEPN domain-containing protein
MTKEDKIQYWLKISESDLQVAEDLLRLKHNLYVGFMCHQCIEKIMKGYYTKVTQEKDDTPPLTHDLPYLANKGGFYELFSEEQKQFIRQLNPLNIRTRYPDYKYTLYKQLTTDVCIRLLEQTKTLYQWIKEKLS